MRTHQALQKKSSVKKAIAPEHALASRPFAQQRKPQQDQRPQENKGLESTLGEFAIHNPDRGSSLPIQPKRAIGRSITQQTKERTNHQKAGSDHLSLITPTETKVAQVPITQVNNSAVVQLSKGVKKHRAGRWYSHHDPFKTFPTQLGAKTYHQSFKHSGRKKIDVRVPTLYTFTHTKPTSKISSVPQGPHTVAHKVSLEALLAAQTVADVKKIFDEQVLTPAKAKKIVFTHEAPSSGYNSQLQARLERYETEYTQIYQDAETEFAKAVPDLIIAKDLTNRLLNLDPYAVYAWKTTVSASKKSLKGKGESKANPEWEDVYDAPPSNSIKNQVKFKSFLKKRKTMFKNHF